MLEAGIVEPPCASMGNRASAVRGPFQAPFRAADGRWVPLSDGASQWQTSGKRSRRPDPLFESGLLNCCDWWATLGLNQ